MILDGHAHISPESYSSIEKLLHNMEDAQIDKTVLFPGGMLDVRRMTNYVIGKDKPVLQEPPNAYVLQMMREHPGKFYGYGNVNPNQKPEEAQAKLEELHRQGFSGLKMSPMVHQFSLLGKSSKALADLCGQLKMPFYTHTIFHASASTASLGKLAAEFPHTTFIIGHMGFGPLDVEAQELAETMDNVYLETSTCNFLALEEAVRRCGHEKIIFGSEFPLSDPFVEKMKVERLSISDDRKEYIYSKNMLALLEVRVPVA